MNKDEKTTIETPAATPAQEPTTETQHGSMPDHLKDVKMEDTFLPEETQTEEPKTEEKPKEEAKTEDAPKTEEPKTEEKPKEETPAAPATETEQPKTAANAEIVDKTKTEEPKLLAGKYKTVDELKHAIEELGGDPTGIDDPGALEQGYYAAQKVYNRMTERNKKAEEAVPAKEEPKKWEMTDQFMDELMKEVDFNKVEDAGDLLKQAFQIMFKKLPEILPKMYPQEKQPQLTAEETAAAVTRVQTNTDSLAFIEAKVPRLTTDQNFRVQFANHLAAGKKAGTYPDIIDRDIMVTAMKDFLAGIQSMAEEAKKMEEQNNEDKKAAAAPDGGGTPASTESPADEEGDILLSIVGAKETQDKKTNFTL